MINDKLHTEWARRPKTITAFMKQAIALSNVQTSTLKGINSLTEQEQRVLSEISVVIQNELGEHRDLLARFDLTYP